MILIPNALQKKSMAIKTLWMFFILFAWVISAYALSYFWLSHSDDDFFSVKYKTLNQLLIYCHFVGAGFALLLCSIQLLLTPASRYHKFLGIAYCMAVLVGAIGGCYLCFYSYMGPKAGLGFFLTDSVWLYTTLNAYCFARKKNIIAHRIWMLRSVAVTCSGISLRVMLPVLSLFFTFDTSYVIVAWTSFVINLLLIEIYIRRTSSNSLPFIREIRS